MSFTNQSKMFLYNLFPTLAGNFSLWPSHIARAAQMGFNWIFLNPIQLPGMSGSLYSIKDYHALNPQLTDPESPQAPQQQLREAIGAARERGMGVMIDLVINHTAIDSPLTRQHPEWFRHDKDGSIAHPYAMDGDKKVVWGDLARLDHKNSRDAANMYDYFRGLLDYLIGLGFSGFRCDAAYQIPQETWKKLISDTKASHAGIVFAAETLGCSREQTIETASAGFDYIFNSSKWWDFKSPWLMEQYDLFREICPSISFPESHDTPRVADEFNGNVNALRRSYLFSAFFSAGVMIPMGFEFGFIKRLHVVNTRPDDWEKTEMDISSFIGEVNRIKSDSEAFTTEAQTRIFHHKNNSSILIIEKRTPSEIAIAAINIDLNDPQRFLCENIQGMLPGSIGEIRCMIPGKDTAVVSGALDHTMEPGDGIILIGKTKDAQ